MRSLRNLASHGIAGRAQHGEVLRSQAEVFLKEVDLAPMPGEHLMREAVKRVRRRLAWAAWELLTEREVYEEVSEVFRETLSIAQASSN